LKNLFIYMLLVLVFSSCMKEADYQGYIAHLHFKFDDNILPEQKVGGPVVFTNTLKNYSITSSIDSDGNVSIKSVEPGFYSAQLSYTRTTLGKEYIFNAREDVEVLSNVTDTLIVSISTTGAFVIKEYYYSGCLTPSGNSYSADQFIEIYNQTSEIQYVDGMSILEHESYGLEPNYWTWLEDTIVCRMIWTIPGEGTDYPVNPGEGVVLARDAFDHKSDPLGNPLCPVDMGHADFEFFVYSASGDDIDGAYSPNLIEDLVTFRGTDIVFHTRGGSAIALARIPGNNAERKAFIASHLTLKNDLSSSRYYGKIPNEWVIDAVEVVFDEAHAVYKRFPDELDAGYTYNPFGSKTGLSLRRKIKEVVDGRVIYQDTNNSIVDFLKGVEPKPWIYEYE
jgi:hypothetical protein